MPKGVYPRKTTCPHARFLKKVRKNVGQKCCWEWLPCKRRQEYGYFWTGSKQDGAHRYSLEVKLGRPLTPGECALHTCDNKWCVNPEHLFVGSNGDNSKDMVRKGRKERGEAVYGAKLTAKKVLRMRKMYATGNYGIKDLERIFGGGAIWAALTGECWKHVGGPLATRGLRPWELARKKASRSST